MFLIFFGLSHIENEMKGKVIYKEIFSLLVVGPKGYINFLGREVMVGLGLGPRLWTK